MKFLIDTHTFIWWDGSPTLLPMRVATAISDPSNKIYLSVISIWEIVIKASIGKLNMGEPLPAIIAKH